MRVMSITCMRCAGRGEFLLCSAQQVLCATREVIRAVQMKMQDFWHVKHCRMVNGYQNFERGGAFHF